MASVPSSVGTRQRLRDMLAVEIGEIDKSAASRPCQLVFAPFVELRCALVQTTTCRRNLLPVKKGDS